VSDRSRAIISVIGRDQKGVVARISTYLASCNTNIEDIEQRVMEGLFIMTMLVDLSDLDTTLDELVIGLRKIGDEIGMEVTVRLAGGPPERKRVAVLVTREPHCLEQLLRDRDAGLLNGDLIVVLSNHPDLEPLVREHGIPFLCHPSTDKAAHEEFLLKHLAEYRPDLVVLARYMQVLSDRFVAEYPSRIINIHHSFLPAFAGAKPYHQAFERGVKVIGATGHYVTSDLDEGPIIEQDVVRVSHRDSVADLIRKGRDIEKMVLARAVTLHVGHRVLPYGNKTVVFE